METDASIPFNFRMARQLSTPAKSSPTSRRIGFTVDDAPANPGHTMASNVCLDGGAGHGPTATLHHIKGPVEPEEP